jgi:hypothetical protein
MRVRFPGSLALRSVIVAALLGTGVSPVGYGQEPAAEIEFLAAAFRELLRLAGDDVPRTEGVRTYCLGLGEQLREVRDPPDSLAELFATEGQRFLPSSACAVLPIESGLRYAVRVRGSGQIASLLYVAIEGNPAAGTAVTVWLRHYVGPLWASVWRCAAVATGVGQTVGDCRLFEQS